MMAANYAEYIDAERRMPAGAATALTWATSFIVCRIIFLLRHTRRTNALRKDDEPKIYVFFSYVLHVYSMLHLADTGYGV